MKPKKCQVNDPECHLDVIREWHGDLESNLTDLIKNLKNIRNHSKVAKRAFSEHYAKTVELTKAKTRFTYEVSPELKAPLASVYNILNVILEGYLDKDFDKQKELLNDLLTFSRPEEGTKKLEMEIILRGNGYETRSAEDGEEALKKSKKKIPDIILLDIMMKNKNRRDLGKRENQV